VSNSTPALIKMDSQAFSRWAKEKKKLDDKLDNIVAWSVLVLLKNGATEEHIAAVRKGKHGESTPGRSPNIKRNHGEGYQRIWQDYFVVNSMYSLSQFRRRFRMRKDVFFKFSTRLRKMIHIFNNVQMELVIRDLAAYKKLQLFYTSYLMVVQEMHLMCTFVLGSLLPFQPSSTLS
jgi:hypothetical protein